MRKHSKIIDFSERSGVAQQRNEQNQRRYTRFVIPFLHLLLRFLRSQSQHLLEAIVVPVQSHNDSTL